MVTDLINVVVIFLKNEYPGNGEGTRGRGVVGVSEVCWCPWLRTLDSSVRGATVHSSARGKNVSIFQILEKIVSVEPKKNLGYCDDVQCKHMCLV
jgi:hypothetical protein